VQGRVVGHGDKMAPGVTLRVCVCVCVCVVVCVLFVKAGDFMRTK
jgi:hypothetical protein